MKALAVVPSMSLKSELSFTFYLDLYTLRDAGSVKNLHILKCFKLQNLHLIVLQSYYVHFENILYFVIKPISEIDIHHFARNYLSSQPYAIW